MNEAQLSRKLKRQVAAVNKTIAEFKSLDPQSFAHLDSGGRLYVLGGSHDLEPNMEFGQAITSAALDVE